MGKLSIAEDGENALPLGLPSLPAEIILMIARYLHPIDLNSLMQTCQSGYDLLSPVLHREAITYIYGDKYDSPAPRWAIYNGKSALFKNLLEVDPPSFKPHALADCLRCAVKVGDCDVVKLIVERHPDLITPRTALQLYNDAARRNHLSIVKFFFDWGARINVDAVERFSEHEFLLPLVHAVVTNSIEMAQYILQAGDSPSRRDEVRDGWSALHHAVSIGDLPMTELLLKTGADFRPDFGGETPIFTLVNTARGLLEHFPPESFDDKHKEAVLKALLRHGVDPNESSTISPKRPILHHFLLHQRYAWARILVDAGANVSATDEDGLSVLHLAAKFGLREGFEYFMHAGTDITILSKEKDSILHSAAIGGDLGILELCINAGLDPSSLNIEQLTPCDLAMHNGHKEVYLRLCEITPAESMRKDYNIMTRLTLERNDPPAVKSILDAREGPKWIHSTDDQFLATAICDNNTSLVELLLNYRGNPNRQLNLPESGVVSPLSYAASNRCDLSTIETILRAGATASVEALRALLGIEQVPLAHVQTLLDAGAYVPSSTLVSAIRSSSVNIAIIRLLAHAAKFPKYALNIACEDGDEEIIDALLDAGCNPSYVDHRGRTPLSHAAASSKPITVIKKLLDAGADFSTVDENGKSPLHYAAGHGLEDVVQCLIDAGSDMFQKDRRGNTPLSVALHHSPNMVKRLLDAERTKASSCATDERGAGGHAWKSTLVSIADDDRNTPLHKATWNATVMHSSRRVVDLLLAAGADTEVVNKRGNTPLDLAKEYGGERMADAIYIHRQEQRIR